MQLPVNAKTQKPYQGGNIIALLESGYENQIWATYRQWKELGYQVQKGEKGTHLKKIVTVEKKKKNGDKVKKNVPRGFCVFNIDQVAEMETIEAK